MKKAYFQYYETFEKIVQKFDSAEEREHFRSAIINYGLHGSEPTYLNERELFVWDIVQDLIDDQVHRRETNRDNASKARKAEEPAPEAETPQPAETKTEPKEKSKKFVPPTVEEVQEYCNERNNGISGERFVEYYANKHRPWTTGNQKEPMRDWKAAVRQWERTEKESRNMPQYGEQVRQLPPDRLTL